MMQISPYKSFYKAALTLSFDYETSAISHTPKSWQKFYRYYLDQTNRFRKIKKKISYGHSQRLGAELIFTALRKFELHATWFGTGHTLLKGNKSRKEYRINQTLPSDPHASGWREKIRTFDNDPFTTYKKRSDYYFGDLTEKLREYGEDIQCHTFSHPFLALEPLDNIRMDLEDWQNAATRYGYDKAQILAFPFLGDSFYYHPEIHQQAAYPITGQQWEIEPISVERIEMIHKSGIELITRCGSKVLETPFKSFRNYNGSSLFYMTSKPLELGIFNEEAFCEMVDEIIRNEWLIDYWCHPHNIAEYPLQNFYNVLEVITTPRIKRELWLPTIKEAWNHFKHIKNIEMMIDPSDNGSFHTRIINHNESDISDIGIDIDLTKYIVEKKDGLQMDSNNLKRIVVSVIPSKSDFDFSIRYHHV